MAKHKHKQRPKRQPVPPPIPTPGAQHRLPVTNGTKQLVVRRLELGRRSLPSYPTF